MSFNELKRNKSGFDKLQSALEKDSEASTKNFSDDRYWKPELDKSGNGYAVLRFLPSANGEELPWIQYWDHGFQGPGGWFIEKSLTTLGKADPVSEHNTKLWNTGDEANKDIARKQKRRLHYVSNVLVVSDPKHPEFEGKVMLYRFGKKILEKVKDVMQPQFEDENPLNPFDLWEGSNFKMKMRQIDGFPNYDKSEFTDKCPLDGDEKKLEEIWKQQYSLTEVTEEKNFKNYAELEARFNTVIANSGTEVGTIEESTDDAVATGEKTDDTLDYFKKLAEQE